MGIKLDSARRQWIDLGRPKDVCLAQPDTCEEKGGSLAFWVKVDYFGNEPGIISSRRHDLARGFQLGYSDAGLGYNLIE